MLPPDAEAAAFVPLGAAPAGSSTHQCKACSQMQRRKIKFCFLQRLGSCRQQQSIVVQACCHMQRLEV